MVGWMRLQEQESAAIARNTKVELHLIRHGQTNWNKERRAQGHSESQLTELGIQQAQNLGRRIVDLEFDAIFCSSSLRARQTAEHIFTASNSPICYLDQLREIYLGPWEGHLYDDIAKREPESYQHFWHQPHLFQIEGAESFFQLQQRAVDAIAEIQAQQPSTNSKHNKVAVISHGALIKAYLCYVEGLTISELWTPPLMHNCAHSIVKFNLDKDGKKEPNILQYADQPVTNLHS
jgi:probable phosphoglycerate mutase